jgi:hypothetical protein
MDDLLTDEEMAVVQGDKERCLAVIGAFGTCDGCSAYCRGISKAQSAKTKAALVAKNWKSPEEVSQFLDDHVRITNRAVDQTRADERKAIGEQLHWALEISPKVIPQYVNTLLKGESPNG